MTPKISQGSLRSLPLDAPRVPVLGGGAGQSLVATADGLRNAWGGPKRSNAYLCERKSFGLRAGVEARRAALPRLFSDLGDERDGTPRLDCPARGGCSEGDQEDEGSGLVRAHCPRDYAGVVWVQVVKLSGQAAVCDQAARVSMKDSIQGCEVHPRAVRNARLHLERLSLAKRVLRDLEVDQCSSVDTDSGGNRRRAGVVSVRGGERKS